LPRYEARRTLPAPGATSSVRRALAPGAHWQLEGTERPSFRRRPQLGGSLLFLEVVPLKRLAFQLTGEYAEVELDLETVEDNETQATLSVETARFGGIGRSVPSEALAGLARLVRDPAD